MAPPPGEADDHPVTPAGRLFLRPEMNQIINCALGVANPPDLDATRSLLAGSLLIAHPRFRSLLVRDRRGREHWRRTQVDIERHIVDVSDVPAAHAADSEQVVNDYLADLAVSSPLSADKPLWEIHLLRPHRCVILRVHHALGDGISLMSMFLASCRRLDDPTRLPTIGPPGGGSGREGGDRGRGVLTKLWLLMRVAWFTVVYALEFIGRSLWVSDRKTAVSGGAGVELWPRKLATAKFKVDDLKAVKKALPGLTINDVVFGVISYGLSTYLEHRSPKGLQEGLQMTGVAMVNLRKQPGLHDLAELVKSESGPKWGNKFGMFLLPVFYHRTTGAADPLVFLKRAKSMIDRKKVSLEAQLSYKLGDLVMSCLGPKAALWLNYRILCNTTFTFSNVIGPQEEIGLTGNPVTYMRANTCGLPHAITMHMVSYAGRADMQILAAKDIVPDPLFLARCFEDALMEFKEAMRLPPTQPM